MVEIVRGIGTTGKKIGVRAKVLSELLSRKTVTPLEEQGSEDYHSLNSTETAQVGQGCEVPTQARHC